MQKKAWPPTGTPYNGWMRGRRLMCLGGMAVVFSCLAWAAAGLVILQGTNPGNAVVHATTDLRALQEQAAVGDAIDSWRNVPVRANGFPYDRSVGAHSSATGYYYGRQWQCVEFVKRFYFDALGHSMPDVMGDAKDFFDPWVGQGAINPKRGLRQFWNGCDEAPRVDDLVVWNEGNYGHVAIISRVGTNEVELVQQNVRQGSRLRLPLLRDGGYRILGNNGPAGWLRIPAKE